MTGEDIADEVEDDLRTINATVVQGWMAVVLTVAVLVSIG